MMDLGADWCDPAPSTAPDIECRDNGRSMNQQPVELNAVWLLGVGVESEEFAQRMPIAVAAHLGIGRQSAIDTC